jgi:hypothetical protein
MSKEIQQWEYEYVNGNGSLMTTYWGEDKEKNLVKYLNSMGAKGWELVEYNNITDFCIFKRPKQQS